MVTVTLARQAMATRFELVLHGDSTSHLQAAAEEALEEIHRLDGQLSLYNPASDIFQINSQAAHRPVQIEPRLFELIDRARRLSEITQGAFDITVGPLMRCWGFMGETGQVPEAADLARARACCGSQHLLLNRDDYTIAFAVPGMVLDLGAIGKGYALDCAAEILREAGVQHGLLHGGTSTVIALGHPPGSDSWCVGIERPPIEGEPQLLTKVPLRNEALSVSALWGKSFQRGTTTYGHVIDPRTGQPVQAAWLSAVISPSATDTDALSTALLTLGPRGETLLRESGRASQGLLIVPTGEGNNWRLHSWGLDLTRLPPLPHPNG